jgi:hypothetical protein
MKTIDKNPENASPEMVAYQLWLHVMKVEGRPLDGTAVSATGAKISRNLILDAYADCLDAVRGARQKRGARL